MASASDRDGLPEIMPITSLGQPSPQLQPAQLQPLPPLSGSGAAETRGIQRALRPEQDLRPSNSTGDLQALERQPSAAMALAQPQAFRRHFVEQRRLRRERQNFTERLVTVYGNSLFPLLGYYADDDDEDDNDGDDADDASDGYDDGGGRHASVGSRRLSRRYFHDRSRLPTGRMSVNDSEAADRPLLDGPEGRVRPDRGGVKGTGGDTGEGGASPAKVVFTILKAFVASAVLFLPKGFQNGGWAAALATLLIIAALSIVCMVRLVDTRKKVGGSIGDIGSITVGPWGRIGVQTAIVVSQMAFCAVYGAYVASNLADLLASWGVTDNASIPLLVFIQLIVLVPLNWVRRLRYFAASNILADVLIVLGLFTILAYAIKARVDATHAPVVHAYNSDSYPVFLGTSVYAFEGIGTVIPIYQSGNARARKNFNFIMSTTLIGVVLFMCLFGLVGYFSFGEDTHAVITFNLPCGNNGVVYAVQVGYCIALILTNPVMMFPAIHIVEHGLTPLVFHAGKPTLRRKWAKNLERALLVVITLAVAVVGGSDLDSFVSVIGSVACVPLAFIFPAMFHFKAFPNQSLTGKLVDCFFMLFGCGVLVYSTYVALSTWSSASSKSPCRQDATANNTTEALLAGGGQHFELLETPDWQMM